MGYEWLQHRRGINRYIPKRLYPILLYHHIGSIDRLSRSYMEPALFEKQLRKEM